ncbi:hypothetical protein JZ751_005335 [Albula glossodonta]|uniref:Uncharacterized protein n=1 Tax=Albula glossodonta TaxID=121402 RepID=A0A8T2N515_9TELE|nr:hypothetical protein JZ751_028710 [Albula glossodonta]KAG9335333.1 hypothetical protein JZ751_005335 [Albula glossodonta]
MAWVSGYSWKGAEEETVFVHVLRVRALTPVMVLKLGAAKNPDPGSGHTDQCGPEGTASPAARQSKSQRRSGGQASTSSQVTLKMSQDGQEMGACSLWGSARLFFFAFFLPRDGIRGERMKKEAGMEREEEWRKKRREMEVGRWEWCRNHRSQRRCLVYTTVIHDPV